MLYKKILILCCLILLNNCTATTLTKNKNSNTFDNPFINKGFSLIYNSKFYDNKVISKKIDERSLIIFQKNLPIFGIIFVFNLFLLYILLYNFTTCTGSVKLLFPVNMHRSADTLPFLLYISRYHHVICHRVLTTLW